MPGLIGSQAGEEFSIRTSPQSGGLSLQFLHEALAEFWIGGRPFAVSLILVPAVFARDECGFLFWQVSFEKLFLMDELGYCVVFFVVPWTRQGALNYGMLLLFFRHFVTFFEGVKFFYSVSVVIRSGILDMINLRQWPRVLI